MVRRQFEAATASLTSIARSIGMFLRLYPRQAQGGESRGFRLHDCKPGHGTRVVDQKPLSLAGPADPWSFIASWENRRAVFDSQGAGLRLELDVRLVAGRAEAGLLAEDFATFLCRADIAVGEQTVVLEVPKATAAMALVIRNAEASEPAIVEVTAFREQLVRGLSAKERGFVTKSAVDDLAARLTIPDVVVVDVGANRGDMVARFSASFPTARVWALEPHPETYSVLTKRFSRDSRVRLRNLALSSRTGSTVMHSYTNSAINSLSPIVEGAARLVDGAVVATQEVTVELQSLDDFCSTEGLGRIDILKLDTQGHETEILGAAGDLLRSGRIRYVLIELLFLPLYASQAKAGDAIALLESSGFRLFDFYDFVYGEDQGLKWGDALFEFVGEREKRNPT